MKKRRFVGLSSTVLQVENANNDFVLSHVFVHNPDSATRYLNIWYLTGSSVTAGVTTPEHTIGVAAGTTEKIYLGDSARNYICINMSTSSTGFGAPTTGSVGSIFWK